MGVLGHSDLWLHVRVWDRIAHANHSSHGVLSGDLGVVRVNKLLNEVKWRVCQLLRRLRYHLCDFLQVIIPYILVADVLEHFTGYVCALEACRVNKVAEVAPGASSLSVVVSAGHSSVVSWLD